MIRNAPQPLSTARITHSRLARRRESMPDKKDRIFHWGAKGGRAATGGRRCVAGIPLLRSGALGPVAQWSELAAHNRLVGGSSPPGPTSSFRVQDSGDRGPPCL